ncbi:MAG: hypothetical protein U1F39_10960 [Steroidobacteraceae bacterium]
MRRFVDVTRSGGALLLGGVLLAGAVALVSSGAEAPAPAQAPNLAAALGEDWKTLPDWRGVWFLEGPLLFGGPENTMVPPDAKSQPRVIRGVEFAQGVPAGAYLQHIPYKPEYQKQYEATVARAKAAGRAQDPVENCWLPHGMPRLAGAGPGAVEFHLTPKRTWIIWDAMNQTRRIATDGSTHPADEDWPRVMGHSVGRWEGQTLVVDTVWMKPGILDRSGAPYSNQLHLTERYTRTAPDTLTLEMTLEDPVMFTAPWKVTRRYKRSTTPQENVRGTYCDVGDTQAIKVKP